MTSNDASVQSRFVKKIRHNERRLLDALFLAFWNLADAMGDAVAPGCGTDNKQFPRFSICSFRITKLHSPLDGNLKELYFE